MIRIYIILLVTFSKVIVFSQSIGDEISISCRNFNYSELVFKLDSFKKVSTVPLKYKWHNIIEREIVDNSIEQFIKFEKNVKKQSNPTIYTIYTYNIKLIKKDNELIYYKIYKKEVYKNRPNSRTITKEIVFGEDKKLQKYKEFKKAYKKTYKSILNFNEIFVSDIRYGNYCGMGSEKAVYRRELEDIIDKRQIHKLKNWLKSGTVELQLYAIDGIYILQEKGFKFKESTLELIDEIEKKDGKAWICVEDIVTQENITDIVKKIKKEHNRVDG